MVNQAFGALGVLRVLGALRGLGDLGVLGDLGGLEMGSRDQLSISLRVAPNERPWPRCRKGC